MWPNPQLSADLIKFTEEIVIGKLHFLCSVWLMFVSFIYRRNRYGPKLTLNFLFDRYDLNQRMTSSENSQNFILLIRISWLIVSNAFWRSMSIIPVWRPNSKAVVILLFRIERHESAEKYFLNLDWNL